jgi:hypothetical protein
MCVWVIGLRETKIKLSHYRMKNHYIKIVVGKSLGKQHLLKSVPYVVGKWLHPSVIKS